MAKYVVKKNKAFSTKDGYAKVGDIVELGDDSFTKPLVDRWLKNGVIERASTSPNSSTDNGR